MASNTAREPTTTELIRLVTADRLRLIRRDMLELRAGLAATMPGKMDALDQRLASWMDVVRDGERELRATVNLESSDGQ